MATFYLLIDIMNILIKKEVQQQFRIGTSEGSFTILHKTGGAVVGGCNFTFFGSVVFVVTIWHRERASNAKPWEKRICRRQLVILDKFLLESINRSSPLHRLHR